MADAPKGLAGALGVTAEEEEAEAPAEGEGADYDAAKAEVGQAVMSAMKAGDATAFTSALADFVKLCM